MHPVVKHLLARKGKAVPVDDGRKIALVLFGGGMAGIRAGGSLIALEKLGLTEVFDDIYTISAGFAAASYFLSGQAELGKSIYLEDLSKSKFINFLRPWKIVNVDHMIKVMGRDKALDISKILNSQTKLHARIFNKDKKEPEYFEVHNLTLENYLHLMEATTSIPYLHPGSTKIGNYHYKDCPLNSTQWLEHYNFVCATKATDIFVIYNNYEQYSFINQNRAEFDKDKVFEIYPPEEDYMIWRETNPKRLLPAANWAEETTKLIFEQL